MSAQGQHSRSHSRHRRLDHNHGFVIYYTVAGCAGSLRMLIGLRAFVVTTIASGFLMSPLPQQADNNAHAVPAARILLVEDNIHDVELILRALAKNQLADDVLHLRDGVEAIDFLFAGGVYGGRTCAASPRVIFLDLKLPKVDGLEVLKRVKEDPRTRTIPVVMLTSSYEESDIRKCYSLGVNSYIVKPVNFDALIRAIAEVGQYWLEVNAVPPSIPNPSP